MHCPGEQTVDDNASVGREHAGRSQTLDVWDTPSPASDIAARQDVATKFSALYHHWVSHVYAYFYHQVGGVEDADDLTATTFTRALASFDRFQASRGTVAAWLFGIARNCLREHRRRPRRHEQLVSELADRHPLPEMQVIAAERAAALQRAIQQLPADQRDAIALRIFAGLRISEVAGVLGKSEGAIKMLVHRAIRTLRERSKQEDWR